VRLRERSGRDAHGAAAELERLAGPRFEHRVDAFVHDLAAVLPADTGHLVLLGPVTEAEDGDGASAAEEIEHGEVLGHAQRVV
jgi:hypothetical protein